MVSIYFLFGILLCGFSNAGKRFEAAHKSSTFCGIESCVVPFLFTEISENFTVGDVITTRKTENVSGISAEENDYVSIKLNSQNEIEFVLKKHLSEYRIEEWKPVLEFKFYVHCTEDMKKDYNFLVVVKDENLVPPTFKQDFYVINALIPESWPENSVLINPEDEIIITDLDYNDAYSHVEVDCRGSNCDNFFIDNNKSDRTGGGHHFEIKLHLKPEAHFLNTYNIELFADDGLLNSSTTVTIFAKKTITETNKIPMGTITLTTTAAGVTIALLLGSLIFLYKKKRKAEGTLRKLTEAEIREFEEGSVNFGGAVGKRSVDVNAPILSRPYRREFDIPRENLRIDETSILGTGAFGIVMKGTVHRSKESTTVAVKTVKRNVGVLYFKALLSELKIMGHIGSHQNVVGLVGACTHNIRKMELYIAVEYCSNGNFHNYLRCRREAFQNLVQDGLLQAVDQNAAFQMGTNSFTKTISTTDLIKWSYQIANGLEYLTSKDVIHGDLATRNILLDDNRIAKIGDFGLSRRIIDYTNNYYRKTSQTPLPWKWLAPESLRDMKFSMKSDIWSFGVVLWEIFTLGQTPYPGVALDETFYQRLERGLRMPKPEYASDALYEMMKDCWTADPDHRPVIFDIKRMLESMINSLLQQQGMGYMRVLGQQPILGMGSESSDGYLIPIHESRSEFC